MSKQNKITAIAGNPRAPLTSPLDRAVDLGIRQALDKNGGLAGDLDDPQLPKADARMLYETMALLRAIDERGWKLQRSGRIAFWIPLRGQEAAQVGAAHAMKRNDWIFRTHREFAPWIMRGEPLYMLFAQFFGAVAEPLKGRRLPCLIGNGKINLISTATPIGAYIPHGAGAGWAARLLGRDEVVLTCFGDGATSRGEFHSAMNFAGIHKPQVVFLCINNGWAVSTPLDRQTAASDFASKGAAYNVPSLRVDGNDALAVYAVVKAARDGAKENGATLIEAVTYRLGYHTSSDNPDLYRQEAECELWAPWDPLKRMRGYLERAGWWSDVDEAAMHEKHQADIQEAVDRAETMPAPGPESQFEDIYAESNWMLDEQRTQLLADLNGNAS